LRTQFAYSRHRAAELPCTLASAWASAADLTQLLEAAGVDRSKAADFAWMLFASTEGALVFARAEHSMRALDLVEQQLLSLGATLA